MNRSVVPSAIDAKTPTVESVISELSSIRTAVLMRLPTYFGTDRSKTARNIQSFALAIDEAILALRNNRRFAASGKLPMRAPIIYWATKTENRVSLAVKRAEFNDRYRRARAAAIALAIGEKDNKNA